MIPYLALLIPIPVLMYMYNYTGIWFLVIGEVLSLMWVFMALKGFRSQDDDGWAKKVFLFSVNYLTIILIVMILDTVRL
ncbi:Protoheme IX farnesyltransferase 2 [compost metagenome]